MGKGAESEDNSAAAGVSKNKRYRKDKPWDHDGIDHWKEVDLAPDDVAGPFLEESSFATLFPQYREKYLREVWPAVTRALDAHGVGCELNLVEGSMTVKTTRKTWDPFVVLKARDLIKLLARSVPVQQAVKILREGTYCDVVKLGSLVRNKERFVKRRQRLIGPNGSTLKAIELLTECYVLVQGNTVAAMGSHKGLKQVRRIAEECMQNVHPVYNIKALMIKRELAKDEALKHENWERFLPKFKKKNQKKKAPKKTKKSSASSDNPFPPLPTPRIEDIKMETGEYFMSEREKREKKQAERDDSAREKRELKQQKREADYVAPPLTNAKTNKQPQSNATADLVQSVRRKEAKRKKKSLERESPGTYLAPSAKRMKRMANAPSTAPVPSS